VGDSGRRSGTGEPGLRESRRSWRQPSDGWARRREAATMWWTFVTASAARSSRFRTTKADDSVRNAQLVSTDTINRPTPGRHRYPTRTGPRTHVTATLQWGTCNCSSPVPFRARPAASWFAGLPGRVPPNVRNHPMRCRQGTLDSLADVQPGRSHRSVGIGAKPIAVVHIWDIPPTARPPLLAQRGAVGA
jgi:hypothetical protein